MIQSLNNTINNPLNINSEEFINNILDNKPIVLVGMMASGKTAIGKLLAKKLKRNFYDLDNLIENEMNTSINEIFQNEGEEKFRNIEYRQLTKIKDYNSVIASGGGTYINPKCHKYINDFGFTIWIKASSNIILQRTKNNNHRPLLAGSDIIKKIKKLLKIRSPIYAKAKLSITTVNKNKTVMTKKVTKSLEEYLIENPNG